MLGIADRDGGFNDDRRLDAAAFGRFPDEGKDAVYRGAVKKVLLRIVIGRGGDDNEIRRSICGRGVQRSVDVQDPFARLRFAKILFNIGIPDRGEETLQFFHSLREDIHCGHQMVLRKQDRKRQADVAGPGDGDPVCAVNGDGFRCRGIDVYLGRVKFQNFRKGLELADGGNKVKGFQTGDQGTVNAGFFGKCRLCYSQGFSA